MRPNRPMAEPKISTIRIRTNSEASAASASAAPEPDGEVNQSYRQAANLQLYHAGLGTAGCTNMSKSGVCPSTEMLH